MIFDQVTLCDQVTNLTAYKFILMNEYQIYKSQIQHMTVVTNPLLLL